MLNERRLSLNMPFSCLSRLYHVLRATLAYAAVVPPPAFIKFTVYSTPLAIFQTTCGERDGGSGHTSFLAESPSRGTKISTVYAIVDLMQGGSQLLYEIFICSRWHTLPYTSKHLYAVFKYAPSSIQAEYLLARHADAAGVVQPGNTLITRLLRYPVCTPVVLEAVLRHPHYSSNSCDAKGVVELPRRLFRRLPPRSTRPWTSEDEPLSFLRYLYDHPKLPQPDANCWNGYALTRAVASGFIPLVQFLLEHGASPACKSSIAVHAAIRRKNLPLVKMLIEPNPGSIQVEARAFPAEASGQTNSTIRKKRKYAGVTEARTSAKKRKLEDRVLVDQEMLRTAVACDARDIVKYFMEDKSCMPDMQTVRIMRN
jgi:hypothetical protein